MIIATYTSKNESTGEKINIEECFESFTDAVTFTQQAKNQLYECEWTNSNFMISVIE